MNFNEQNRSCHAEPFASLKGKLREASLCSLRQTLRCAQGDNTLPILIVKTHNRRWARSTGPYIARLSTLSSYTRYGYVYLASTLVCGIVSRDCSCSFPRAKDAKQVRNILSSFTRKRLLSPFSLLVLLVLLSLPLLVYLPQRLATGLRSSTVQTLLTTIKEMNYYSENAAWTNMWTRFDPTEIDHDFAKIHGVGFNMVRIILQAQTGVFDYPTPTPAERDKLSQVVTLAAGQNLK